jgi:hypothetical protein
MRFALHKMLKASTYCLRLLLLLAAFLTAVSCDPFDWSFDEVARITSPSGKVDAVLVERNGGATTSFGYNVYVVPKGKPVSKRNAEVAKLYGAVRNKSAYGVNLRWEGASNLAAEYLSAENAEVLKESVEAAGEQVIITLRPNINDPSAPAGGMLYNLEKNR